jgi:hypothetical protein
MILTGLAVILLGSCSTPMAYYNQAEQSGVVILPDNYEVNFHDYPRYRIKRARRSPTVSRMQHEVWMSRSDIWVVTHKIGSDYLIFSMEYNERLCRENAKWMRKTVKENAPCHYYQRMEILINSAGDVVGRGWVGVDDPRRVLWSGDRMVDLPLGESADSIWGPQPSFEKIGN